MLASFDCVKFVSFLVFGNCFVSSCSHIFISQLYLLLGSLHSLSLTPMTLIKFEDIFSHSSKTAVIIVLLKLIYHFFTPVHVKDKLNYSKIHVKQGVTWMYSFSFCGRSSVILLNMNVTKVDDASNFSYLDMKYGRFL